MNEQDKYTLYVHPKDIEWMKRAIGSVVNIVASTQGADGFAGLSYEHQAKTVQVGNSANGGNTQVAATRGGEQE